MSIRYKQFTLQTLIEIEQSKYRLETAAPFIGGGVKHTDAVKGRRQRQQRKQPQRRRQQQQKKRQLLKKMLQFLTSMVMVLIWLKWSTFNGYIIVKVHL